MAVRDRTTLDIDDVIGQAQLAHNRSMRIAVWAVTVISWHGLPPECVASANLTLPERIAVHRCRKSDSDRTVGAGSTASLDFHGLESQ